MKTTIMMTLVASLLITGTGLYAQQANQQGARQQKRQRLCAQESNGQTQKADAERGQMKRQRQQLQQCPAGECLTLSDAERASLEAARKERRAKNRQEAQKRQEGKGKQAAQK